MKSLRRSPEAKPPAPPRGVGGLLFVLEWTRPNSFDGNGGSDKKTIVAGCRLPDGNRCPTSKQVHLRSNMGSSVAQMTAQRAR